MESMTTETATAKNAAISAQILKLVSAGVPLRDAIDAVLGAGTFDRVAGDAYDALRAKAAG